MTTKQKHRGGKFFYLFKLSIRDRFSTPHFLKKLKSMPPPGGFFLAVREELFTPQPAQQGARRSQIFMAGYPASHI